jgi:hypothetical protein
VELVDSSQTISADWNEINGNRPIPQTTPTKTDELEQDLTPSLNYDSEEEKIRKEKMISN